MRSNHHRRHPSRPGRTARAGTAPPAARTGKVRFRAAKGARVIIMPPQPHALARPRFSHRRRPDFWNHEHVRISLKKTPPRKPGPEFVSLARPLIEPSSARQSTEIRLRANSRIAGKHNTVFVDPCIYARRVPRGNEVPPNTPPTASRLRSNQNRTVAFPGVPAVPR